MIQKQPFHIVSAERPGLAPDVNTQRNTFLARRLEASGLEVIPVTGRYRGTPEHAFLVFDLDETTEDNVRRIARTFEQESVLHVDGSRRASLEHIQDGRTEELGTFRAVSPDEARTLDSLTQTQDGTLYAAVRV